MTDLEYIEWRSKRLGRFTASEIYKLFTGGKRPMTPEELKAEKASGGKRTTVSTYFGDGSLTYIRTKVAEILTMQYKDSGDFKQAEWGHMTEPAAIAAFEQAICKKGIYYGSNNPKYFEYGEHAGGSPDWESLDASEGADMKCPFNTAEHINNLLITSAEELKAEHFDYYCQGQMYMLMRGWKVFHFVSYDPRMVEEKYRLKIIKVYPDAEWQSEFKERLAAAVEEVQSMIAILAARPVIAHYEPELKSMILQ